MELTKLVVRYNVGVQVRETFELKQTAIAPGTIVNMRNTWSNIVGALSIPADLVVSPAT
jgi:hypothetical protein